MQRKRNPAGAVPVLLMNPTEKDTMATRRKATRRRRPAARRAPAKRRAPARRRRAAPARRRRITRRRRNPKFDVMGTLFAAVGGAAMGAAGYAVSQQNVTPNIGAAIIGGGGLVLGAAASGFHKTLGAGIAGGGAALAAGILISQYWKAGAATSAMYGMGAVQRRYMSQAQRNRQMNAVAAPVGARQQLLMSGVGMGEMGAVRAPVGHAIDLDLSGLS